MAPLKPVRATALAAIPIGIGLAVAAAVSAMGTGGGGPTARTPDHARSRVSANPAAPPVTGLATARPSRVARTVSAGGSGLSRLRPVQVFSVTRLRTAPAVIGGTSYPDSILFTCAGGGHISSGDIDYVVAGYGALVTTIAVRPGADGTASVSFFNNGSGVQVAGPYQVSPGHPRAVHVRFPGASQLEISCTPSARSPGINLALANPILTNH